MLNLNGAFRLRNRLKDKIAHLNKLIEDANYEKEKGAEENTSKLDGKTLEATINESTALMDLLRELNQAITRANAPNREDLISLESLRAKIALFETVARHCRNRKSKEEGQLSRVLNEEVWKETVYDPVLDQTKYVAALNDLKKEKEKLEDILAGRNAEFKVDFDKEKILQVL
jgi:CRISPR/Cas system CSM-associated protein Csm2 small subunit